MLQELLGTWHGTGTVYFPTIETVAYREILRVAEREADDAVIYEQQTWKSASDGSLSVPSHWETGFLIPDENGSITALTAHDPRTEVLTGTPVHTDAGWSLELVSTEFSNDPRMRAARRKIVIEARTLTYTMDMATTAVPNLTRHLEAKLLRR